MVLAQFVADKRSAIFAELLEGHPPSEGVFDEAVFLEAKDKGAPQMGATRFAPSEITFEFIYPNPNGAPILLPVRLAAPERIVFMPVPDWVVVSVWQGEVAGSPRFESEAKELLSLFSHELEKGRNEAHFEEKAPIGRH